MTALTDPNFLQIPPHAIFVANFVVAEEVEGAAEGEVDTTVAEHIYGIEVFQGSGSGRRVRMRFRVRFVIEDGGMGKSRLGAEFAEEMCSLDRAVGFIPLHKPSSFKMHRNGTLLVIDYPAEHVESASALLRC